MDAIDTSAHPPRPLQRRVRRGIAYGASLAMPVPRTAAFVASQWWRARTGTKSWPAPHLSPAFVGLVALDEFIVQAMKTPGQFPRRADYERAYAELHQMHALHEARGWDDAETYHVAPPPQLEIPIRRAPVYMRGWRYLRFPSGYAPHEGEPGTERWHAHAPNTDVHAFVLQGDPRRPWVVCLHPFGTGYGVLDARTFRAVALHRELGYNVMLPALPLHGPRKIHPFSGTGFMTYNPVDIVHGLAQSAWDVRLLLSWIRAQGGERIALYGTSLGAHVSSLVASLDDGLAGVILGVPTSNLLDVFARHVPLRLRKRAEEWGLLGAESRRIHSVVTPLSLQPKVARDRRFIYAATGDRMATPKQAYQIWTHWEEPAVKWFDSNHIGFLWSDDVATFVRDALHTSLDT
jgi:hypothetical protein